MKNITKSSKIMLVLGVAIAIIGAIYFFMLSKESPGSMFGKQKPILKVGAIGFYDPQDAFDLFFVQGYLSKHYDVQFVEKGYDLLLTGSLTKKKRLPKNSKIIKIHQTGEVFVGHPKEFLKTHDLILGFDYIDAPNYLRVPFSYFMHDEKMSNSYKSKWRKKCNPSSKKYFACFLVSNGGRWSEKFDGARERTLVFHRFSLYKFVRSGGKFLNNVYEVLPRNADNEEWLSDCKFTIAYENQYYPGYITEKVYQAYFAGTIPIYKAHPSVLNELNSEAMVLGNNFETHEELLKFVQELDQDDEKYCAIWKQPLMAKDAKDHNAVKKSIEARLDKIMKERFHPILKEREAKMNQRKTQ